MLFSTPEDGATSPQGSEALSVPSFEPFSRLPLELRRRIWELAVPATGVGPGVCLLLPCFTPTGQAAHRPQTVRNPYSSLMETSKEARETALESLPLTRDYNPETDILYISADNFYSFCSVCRAGDWPSQIQHLALALPVAERGLWLPIAMKNLNRLETISVVYPKATGEVDVHEDVLLPKQAHLMLRRFTDDEMDAFKINADYLYETHGGDIPIVWTKSAREHLDLVREELTRWTRPGASLSAERPLCWDDETGSLRLTFEARCFEMTG